MDRERWWPSSNWTTGHAAWPETRFTPHIAKKLGIDERSANFFSAFVTQGKDSNQPCCVCTSRDAASHPLQGASSYRLSIPAGIPTNEKWIVAAYDIHTAGFIRESPRVAVDSNDPLLKRNADDSVDLYFGPSAPAGQENNWICTHPNRPWLCVMQLRSPQQAFFDKTWALPDLQEVSAGG
jgi:hypothetical protein